MLLYVAGPYRGNISENIQIARKAAIALWEMGHAVICPHMNTAYFEDDCNLTIADYLRGDFNMISRCDAIIMLPGWERSEGAVKEHTYATVLKIPVYYYPDNLPELHPTELSAPEQVAMFRNIIMRLYRTHLDKNADYSPNNINGTGEVGLMTRLWDKIARLMNLTGFRIKVKFKKYKQPKSPKCEPIEDTIVDTAVYAINWLIYRAGKWGK